MLLEIQPRVEAITLGDKVIEVMTIAHRHMMSLSDCYCKIVSEGVWGRQKQGRGGCSHANKLTIHSHCSHDDFPMLATYTAGNVAATDWAMHRNCFYCYDWQAWVPGCTFRDSLAQWIIGSIGIMLK
jgi:hypothetical protein